MRVIYRIFNKITGKQYIGSTNRPNKRYAEHTLKLRKGRHHSVLLQRAWNKYGEGAFLYEILWNAGHTREDQLYEEQQALNNIICEYNVCTVAGSTEGYRHTEDAKVKMRQAKSNISQTTRDSMAASIRSRGPDWRDAIADKQKARWEDHEYREFMANKARNISDVTREKMKEAAKNRGPVSQETRAKLSELGKGKKRSDETRAKMVLAWQERKNSRSYYDTQG